MAYLRKTRLVTTSVFILVLGLQPVVAQSGRNPGITGDFRGVTLAGNVVMADGSPPPEAVAIERVCGAKIVRVGHTDRKGFFNFQLVDTVPSLQDASESGHDAYTKQSDGSPFGTEHGPLYSVLSTMEGCDLRGSLAGFKSTAVVAHVEGVVGPINVGTIVLLRVEKQGLTVSATSVNVPKGAKKAYEKASAQMQKANLADAQLELEQAVRLYPRYAAAWTDLGWLHKQQNHLEEAREAFTHARAADDKFVPAYVGLASVAIRQSKWAEAQELSARATELGGMDFPAGFYYNAVANLQLGQLDKAEKSARMAEHLDMRHALPQVNLLLGSILAAKQNYAEAANQFKLYLKLVPGAPNAEEVRQRLVEFEKLSTSVDPSAPKDLPSAVAVAPAAEVRLATPMNLEEIDRAAGNPKLPVLVPPESWAPPDIDQVVPPVAPGVSCAVHDVVSGVSSRAKQLMDNLQRFSATERIEHVELDKDGNPRAPKSATLTYVAELRVRPGQVSVEEYRNGSLSLQSFPANLATTGTAAHALIFHPDLIDDYTVTCEGLGYVGGQPAWQLHFMQRSDRPSRFRGYQTPKGWFPVGLKGRVWIAVDSYQVMRMETDLTTPIKEISLQKDHIVIDYRAVEFPKRNVQLWLPQTTDLYMDFAGQRSHRRHSFNDFELFWVDVAEKVRDPDVR